MVSNTSNSNGEAQPRTGIKNIVLVHGTWADGSSWAKVIPLLQAKGYHVTAVQNPLTSLTDDVAATKRALALQDGPVLLVGHSWGGVVITEAGNDAKVAGLVYVAAAAPEEGQSFLELVQTAPATPGNDEIRPDASGFVSMTPKGIMEDFAQDLPQTEQQVLISTQGPQAFSALQEKITQAAWKTKPSWYIVAANDRMINPDLERTLAKKMNATTTTLPSSHVVMLSQPEQVAAVIMEAASQVHSTKAAVIQA
ncbi:alpha/beta fold hydrolase [Hymenobacter wooponensis]|uniref:Alpha/beta hydrolase n=1 Tax=Hymenobacter wooponensis TaxID=1525360 RepID=A0A4Z0MTH4_9BACT|nr:alpha/beta hydrolase [Hymenobacter wooponensis]TGD82547.1 alpha/beta hydrolase [Hymenobacter wooponensis]